MNWVDMDLLETMKQLIVESNTRLRSDVLVFLREALRKEQSSIGKRCLKVLIENAEMAKENGTPICQDTGLVNIFLEIPEGFFLPRDLEKTMNKAISEAYNENGFRASTIFPPLGERKNRGDNTPGFLNILTSQGAFLSKVSVMPRGAGAENASFVMMLDPSTSEDDLLSIVSKEIVKRAPYACPPLIVGIGIGSTLDGAALLAKKALLRKLGKHSLNSNLAALERRFLDELNASGIGPCAFGGDTTCLWVFVEDAPTHMASLPVAVSISCHALRSASAEILISSKKGH